MENFSRLGVRWALAYLLIVNSVDTAINNTTQFGTISMNTWTNALIMVAAAINIGGGILLASGWQTRNTAMILAIATGLFSLIYQAPLAMVITAGLLILAIEPKRSKTCSEQLPTGTIANQY